MSQSTLHLGVVMDPISDIAYKKDTTLAMLWAAQERGYTLHYMEQDDLFLQAGKATRGCVHSPCTVTQSTGTTWARRLSVRWPSWMLC